MLPVLRLSTAVHGQLGRFPSVLRGCKLVLLLFIPSFSNNVIYASKAPVSAGEAHSSRRTPAIRPCVRVLKAPNAPQVSYLYTAISIPIPVSVSYRARSSTLTTDLELATRLRVRDKKDIESV